MLGQRYLTLYTSTTDLIHIDNYNTFLSIDTNLLLWVKFCKSNGTHSKKNTSLALKLVIILVKTHNIYWITGWGGFWNTIGEVSKYAPRVHTVTKYISNYAPNYKLRSHFYI